jgi:GntR family transcriptional regulator
MNLEIDFRSGIPIYLQVVERIKERLASGQLKPGDQLPTVRALASDLRVNFNTIARAYRIMDESGIISTQQGRGTYILDTPGPEVIGGIRANALDDLTRRYFEDAERLGASPEEVAEAWNKHLDQWKDDRLASENNEPDKGVNQG